LQAETGLLQGSDARCLLRGLRVRGSLRRGGLRLQLPDLAAQRVRLLPRIDSRLLRIAAAALQLRAPARLLLPLLFSPVEKGLTISGHDTEEEVSVQLTSRSC
jgi:hypothetical protein